MINKSLWNLQTTFQSVVFQIHIFTLHMSFHNLKKSYEKRIHESSVKSADI